MGTEPEGRRRKQKRKPDPKEPFCGLVFKASWHPNGNRFFVRVYSGMLKPNMRAYNPGKDVKENIAKLFHVHADPTRGLEEVESGPAGDIVCVVGLKDTDDRRHAVRDAAPDPAGGDLRSPRRS